MAQQKNIILDNTFLRSQERTSVCNIAKGLNYHTILIWVSTPFRDCLINNVCRRHPVPDKVMREKRRSLQVPSYKEGWDFIVSIKDTDFGLVWDFLTDQFIPLEEFCLNANS
jgi:predicted kinase